MAFKGIAKVAFAVMLLAAVFGGGYTLALFNATTNETVNTFVTGSVRLGQPTSTLINITNMAPGDSGTKTYQVTYTGSLEAWIGLDTRLVGDLSTCDGGGRLNVSISDSTKSYSANAAGQVVAKVASGSSLTFTVNYVLALGTNNPCQEKDAVLGLLVKAVQAANNTKPDNSGPLTWGDVSTLDQTSGPITTDTNGADQIPWAQTFTAGRTGMLDKVDLYVHGPNTLPVTVTIRTVDDSGQPTDTILATAEVPVAGIPADNNLLTVTFAAPAPVAAGTKYAIYRTPLVSGGWSWSQPVQNDPYAAGQAWADRRADLGFWESYASYDLPFRTYVM